MNPHPKPVGAIEPLEDKELRYSRVRILESSASRIHVRWSYQINDMAYNRWGDAVDEDFYFYPDGFGTRVLTLTGVAGSYEFSEFVIVTPKAAFPLEILPQPHVDLLFLNGDRKRLDFPLSAGGYERLRTPSPGADKHGLRGDTAVEQMVAGLVQRLKEQGEPPPSDADLDLDKVGKAALPRPTPVIYRVPLHQADLATAIYFSVSPASSMAVYRPIYDRGELVSPAHWGDNWPLSRGNPTVMGRISDLKHLQMSPAQICLMNPPEPDPLYSGTYKTIDALGQSNEMTTSQWAWLIAPTAAPDEVLRDWARSFSDPPSVTLKGAHLDFPAYRSERRAIRLIVDASSIAIALKPVTRTVNPVFELAGAPQALKSVTLDGRVVTADAYAWDGATLWVKASIDAHGAGIVLQFY